MDLKRYWRVIAGGGLVLLALLALIQNLYRTDAQEAFFNAQLLPLISPIAGRIVTPLPAVGSGVTPSDTVEVDNPQVERSTLIDLQARLSEVEAELLGVKAEQAQLRASLESYGADAAQWQQARRRYLDEQLREARAQAQARQRSFQDLRDQFERLEGSRDSISLRALRAAEAAMAVAEEESRAAGARVAQIQAEQQALQRRLRVATSDVERAYSDQKVAETGVLLRLAGAQQVALEAKRDGLQAAIATQSAQIEAQARVALTLPKALVWKRIPEGVFVPVGGEVGRLALCQDLVLTASMGEREFRRLRVGMQARIRSEDADGKTHRLTGQLIALTGPSAENAMVMAIPFGRAATKEGYGVVVRLDDASALDCPIGRAARVSFRD